MLPPKNPIEGKDGNKISHLEKICEIAKPYLDLYKIQINLHGYRETCDAYFSLKQTEYEKAWELAQELNAWSQYISSYSNLIQDLFLDSETEKLSVQSEKSIEFSDKVATGDRYANTKNEVISARKKRNALKSLYDAMVAEVEFLERAFYACKSTNEWGQKEKNRYVQPEKH